MPTACTTKSIVTAAAILSFLLGGAAQAAPIDPIFDSFGDLQAATLATVTFGGTGIPTDPAAINTFIGIGGDEVVFGLIATPRFFNPPLANDGAGTYFAGAGANLGGPGSTSTTLGALWNFNFFVGIHNNGGNSTVEDYDIALFYDFDPGQDTDDSEHGVIDIDASAALFTPGATESESSQNLLFSIFELGSVAPPITPPSVVTSFDPNAVGEYSFSLREQTIGEEVAINVQVTPEPGAALLLLGGLGGLLALRRRSDR